MMGCKGLPCPNNDDQQCFTDLTGLVCNEAVRCPTGACGTCQFPGGQNDPCVEDADCAGGLYCDEDVCNVRGGPVAQIPAGCFDMGDSTDGCDMDRGDCPVHNVCISGFEMDVHQVTNAEYKECVDGGGCTAPHHSSSVSRPAYYGNPVYADFPVIWMDSYQAETYCAWAGKRLPTEAEWEYAARGGLAGKRYPSGDTINCDDACYWRYWPSDPCFSHCHNGVCDNDTHPVENYAANGYGLFDVAGNVWEWVNDWYDSGYYQYCVDNGIVNDPPGPLDNSFRVCRGGYWGAGTDGLRVAFRTYFFPGTPNAGVGFRCARGGAYGP